MTEYTLRLNSKQARSVLSAVELLMRLKLGQSFTFCESVDEWKHISSVDYHKATALVEEALKELTKDINPGQWKDESWYRLYNIYQALRYQIHLAENSDSIGVDSCPPIKITDEPIPYCRWIKETGDKTNET